MKRSVRLVSLLAATLLLLAACSTAEEAGETATEAGGVDTATEVASEPAAEPAPAETDVADEGADTSGQSILDIARENPQLSQLVAALEAAGLTDALEQAGPLTVFAPNDQAFGKLDQGDLTALLADPASLGDILQYHVAEGAVMSTDLEDGQMIPTLQGSELTVTIDGDTVMVDDAQVVQADVQAGNGVIHIVDTVLQP